jgi:serine/threonine protein kinase
MFSDRKIGNYNMYETLGSGGFSKVKLGVEENTGDRVALKILKKDKLSENQTIRKQVEREIAAMSKIQHENVLTMKDVVW